jgi:hypothetical protein
MKVRGEKRGVFPKRLHSYPRDRKALIRQGEREGSHGRRQLSAGDITGGRSSMGIRVAAYGAPKSRRKQAAQDFDSEEGFQRGTFLIFIRTQGRVAGGPLGPLGSEKSNPRSQGRRPPHRLIAYPGYFPDYEYCGTEVAHSKVYEVVFLQNFFDELRRRVPAK